MDKFEIIDTTADIGIRAFGNNLPEVFSNAAIGMLSLITDLETVKERLEKSINVSAIDIETLLVEWLNELIFLFDTEMLLFSRCEITLLTDTQIQASCFGEKVDKTRHILNRGIKSATYHRLKIDRQKDGVSRADIILDI